MHIIADPLVQQEISDAIERIEYHIVKGDEAKDLIYRVINGWSLEQCRFHVVYKILFLRWHLCASSAEANPDRFFLSFVKVALNELEGEPFARIDHSMRYHA
jgi:hypothetical protein